VIGGRYGLASKEFTPAMAKAVFDELGRESPKPHFTIGITDDVTGSHLEFDPASVPEPAGTVQAVFFGLGSDGTVSANQNSIKIIGEATEQFVQGYFVHDSKKSGTLTISHLRFGPRPIRSTYLIQSAGFVACHQFNFLEKYDVLRVAAPGATFLLNCPWRPDEVWAHLPPFVQADLRAKGLRLFVLDADAVARRTGMGNRINTIMQTAFFALSGVLPRDEAMLAIKTAIAKSYGHRGHAVVEQNYAAVDAALEGLKEVPVPPGDPGRVTRPVTVPENAPEFVRRVTARLLEGRGDELPVSAVPVDGTYPLGTTRWEKRNLAEEIPVWEPDLCIQCGKCTLVCPHAALRMTVFDPARLEGAPSGFASMPARFFREFREQTYTLQVAPEDCTGCGLCVEVCPGHDKGGSGRTALHLEAQPPRRDAARRSWEFFLTLPEPGRSGLPLQQVKYSQLLTPLFEFSGACAGCGETPYLKLVSQLFGDRAVIANATGCSSIYGGNLPTTPWTTNALGRGPAWSNSLFEDNAEFGYGMRVALDHRTQEARHLLRTLAPTVGGALVEAILDSPQDSEADIQSQRQRVAQALDLLAGMPGSEAQRLRESADVLVKKSVWIVGGDGWAYDIGYGGLDHVLASGADVNILVLDTEVYSNTGGQRSKATPRGAVAKFAAAGKDLPKKDLGMLAMTYGQVYVARIAFGADDGQAVRAIVEAEKFPGPSLLLAYSPCIAHGYDLRRGLDQQKAAVASGSWPLYRFHPGRVAQGLPALKLDSKAPTLPLEEYWYPETRYRMLRDQDPEAAHRLLEMAKEDIERSWQSLVRLAEGGGVDQLATPSA
jgi:pyruvate-ferredoxin/flavodoxin oxidoreductase